MLVPFLNPLPVGFPVCPVPAAFLRFLSESAYRCPISDIIPRPGALEEMISIASRLSEPFPFVRVDLYLINGSPIFGEMTFTPDVISNITPELTDQMSKWIDITSLKQQL